MAGKTDRYVWIAFFLFLSITLFLLFLVFGKKPEGSMDPTTNPDFEDLVFDDGSDPELRPRRRQYQGRIQTESAQGKTLPVDEPEEIPEEPTQRTRRFSGAASSKRSEKFHSILSKYSRKARVIPVGEKQGKLRKRLAEKGFVNQDYIDMRVQELDRESADRALKRAAALYKQGRIDEVLSLLKEELFQTDPKNLVIRALLVQSIAGIALEQGYPDTFVNFQRQLLAIRSRINEIKMSTILMDNPVAREKLQQERESIDQLRENPQYLHMAMDYMRENKGFSKDVWMKQKGFAVQTAARSSRPNASGRIRKSFRNLEGRISKNWANPKE